MNIKRFMSSLPVLRPIFLRLLRATARDVSMRNPWTGDCIMLNSFKHKGYWYFGREREAATMRRFAELIKTGSVVVEVGGHIGFISQYFAKLVGPAGRVIVFEPGTNNLPYIERNISALPQVRLEPVAVSSRAGEAAFYEDNITGQNNSLLDGYHGVDSVASSHGMKVTRVVRTVRLTTLDEYVAARRLKVDFLKIDIEGHELAALEGAESLLKQVPALMVEITERHQAVADLLKKHGFVLSDENGAPLSAARLAGGGNVFAFRK